MPKRTDRTPKIGIDLMDVFKEYSPQIMSNGQIRMECPFRDKHPDGSGKLSFFVSPEINAYHCFSCKSHGNLVRLLTTMFKVNYFEAMNMVRLTDYTPRKKEFDLDTMWDINNPPKEFLKRGYAINTLRHFRVGTGEDCEIFIPYYTDFNRPFELVGYQKRWYSPSRRVRNSKGFERANYLYNLDYRFPYTILVEGQSDVWRLFQHGHNATALMGADISDEQIKKLSKFTHIYLALDNDEAGRRATEICYHSLKNETDVLLIPYTTKDPGECLSKDEWEDSFNSSTSYLDYSMEMTMGWDGYLDMREEVINELMKRDYGKF